MYTGPTIDDQPILELLPTDLRDFLLRCNGYVAFHGGLHIRGACLSPSWHSLRYWWLGAGALHLLFPSVDESDVPFGEDGLGDQYLLRGGVVHRLSAESGDIASLKADLREFDKNVREDPIGYLSLGPLEEFRASGGELMPGQLLNVYPPFVMKESADGVSYRAVPTEERIRFLAQVASQVRGAPEGTKVRFQVED
jgi:hypothetical protein